MTSNKQCTPHLNTAKIRSLMVRVELIRAWLPEKHINAKGQPIPYSSKHYQYIDELCDMMEEMNERKPYPIEQLMEEARKLRGTLKALRAHHKQVKESNKKLRQQLGVNTDEDRQ